MQLQTTHSTVQDVTQGSSLQACIASTQIQGQSLSDPADSVEDTAFPALLPSIFAHLENDVPGLANDACTHSQQQ